MLGRQKHYLTVLKEKNEHFYSHFIQIRKHIYVKDVCINLFLATVIIGSNFKCIAAPSLSDCQIVCNYWKKWELLRFWKLLFICRILRCAWLVVLILFVCFLNCHDFQKDRLLYVQYFFCLYHSEDRILKLVFELPTLYI